MAEYSSIFCPKTKDHKFDKRLLFVGKGGLYVYCPRHSWIKLVFKKGNKIIDFDDAAVEMEPMGEKFHFDHEPMPVVALGKFKLKHRAEAKQHANESK